MPFGDDGEGAETAAGEGALEGPPLRGLASAWRRVGEAVIRRADGEPGELWAADGVGAACSPQAGQCEDVVRREWSVSSADLDRLLELVGACGPRW
jgi:hypothetical protein